MMPTHKQNPTTISDAADLGLAMLVLETAAGDYEPVAVVSSIGEARQIASADFTRRLQELERGGDPLCPETYKLWVPGADGRYVAVDWSYPV